MKVAATLRACVMDTVQLPLPEQPPLQPANVYPDAAEALSVTDVPAAYEAEQALPQLIPAGALVTVPLPVRETLSV
ncbi:hypothetical protein SVA_1358 [Sulfurifustis variabilis]|uniref:Uncharacterized protein n=1 Tax=Sulfurifustis variabilis TaxID=1675686 RepID=A0A1B4V3H9_9GAMM|nr:hypothetical protein SVA_1358 [Sulfurifustis variabilis]